MASDKLNNLSPFEFKDMLIKRACSHKDRMMLNAGRGNPNFLATQPRHAFLRIGDFSLHESERAYSYLDNGFGGLPQQEGIVNRFDAYALLNKGVDGINFVRSALSFAEDHLGIAKADFLNEMVGAFLGCNYPVPPKMLPLCQEIVKVYLSNQLCATKNKIEQFDIFATEGGTAAMTYLFSSLKANSLINKGDKIALITPIFSPYLEIPRVPFYYLDIVDIKADETQAWQVTRQELDKLLDPEIKLLFMVNPTNPTSVKMNDHFLDALRDIVTHHRSDLMIVTDDVYATFSDNFRSVFSVCPYNTLCVYSFSKYFGATGWRLGTMMLHHDNVFDKLISDLSDEVKQRLGNRYASLTDTPAALTFIDRLVADSRAVALNHTAGLSLPQQLQMTLFALASILDDQQCYKVDAKRLIRRRYEILYQAIGLFSHQDQNSVDYYTVVDLEELASRLYGGQFSQWLLTKVTGAKFIMRLADETGVVLLPGKGFDVDHPSARVSLANLRECDYREIGKAVRLIMDEFKQEYEHIS